jgi:hypothetical protein
MTTFTTEDREAIEKGLEFFEQLKGGNSSPPHIVDSGASHKTLGDFIAHKKIVNDLLEEIDVQKRVIQSLSETGERLYAENRYLKESVRRISKQLTCMMELWEFKR